MRRAIAALLLGSAAAAASAQSPAAALAGDSIAASLTGVAGDPVRGRAIVLSRQTGLCILCHSGPFPEERNQGNLAVPLHGVGGRLSPGQLRARIVDPSRVNAGSIMPSYSRTEGLLQVAAPYRGKALLSAQQIEDVVAFLETLRD